APTASPWPPKSWPASTTTPPPRSPRPASPCSGPPPSLAPSPPPAVIGTHDPGEEDESPTGGGYLALERLVDCRWHINLDGDPLTEQEMTALADAAWPLIQLRGRWLLVDADTARRARAQDLAPLPSLDALTAALSGTLTLDGEALEARPAGALATLVGTLRGAPDDPRAVPSPAALKATLRHYQQRALTWLANMVDLGFGALLADDMGLGKTVTTIALHLNRVETTRTAGPTLVVCPASTATAPSPRSTHSPAAWPPPSPRRRPPTKPSCSCPN
ncbi:SNF2 helicase-associated domain-containing protein, partial [Streptomyces mirabilis]